MRAASWIVVVIAAGCYQPQREGRCEVSCDQKGQQCPNGLACSNGFCLAPGDPPCTDGSVLPCQMPTTRDDFNLGGGSPCGAWGTASGAVSREVSQLAMRPTTGAPNSVSCITTDPVPFDRGAFVEIPAALTGNTTYTQLEVHDSGGGRLVRIAIARDETGVAKLVLAMADTTLTTLDYVPTTMRWLRLRANDTPAFSAEYSSNGRDWSLFDVVGIAPPLVVKVSFDAGTYADPGGAPGTAVFDNFNVCPQ